MYLRCCYIVKDRGAAAKATGRARAHTFSAGAIQHYGNWHSLKAGLEFRFQQIFKSLFLENLRENHYVLSYFCNVEIVPYTKHICNMWTYLCIYHYVSWRPLASIWTTGKKKETCHWYKDWQVSAYVKEEKNDKGFFSDFYICYYKHDIHFIGSF